MVKKIIFAVLIFSFINCGNTNDEYLIKEGYGVNVFKLNVNVSESSNEIDGITLKINRDSVIYAIDIKSNIYHTKDDLKVGVDYEVVLNQRGMYDASKVIEKTKSLNQKKRKFPVNMRYDGITFFLDDKGIVEKIRIH